MYYGAMLPPGSVRHANLAARGPCNRSCKPSGTRRITGRRGAADGTDRDGRVHGRRYRDQRPGGRPLRADRGRRGARRRRGASRALELVVSHERAAAARYPALTGISQAMVDSAPALEDVLPSLGCRLKDRIMVAHNAPFDRRVLRQAFGRIGLDWPDPPVICTAALARAMLPLQPRAGARGARRRARHRRRARPPGAGRRRDVRPRAVRALSPPVRQRGHRRRRARPALAAASGTPRAAAPARPRPAGPSPRRVDFAELPARPRRLHLPRRPRPRPVRRQVGLDSQPRPRPLRAVEPAGGMDTARDGGRLPHDRVRARRPRAREPPDQGAQAARQQAADPHRRPAHLHPLPAGHPVSDPRGIPGPGRRARGDDRAGAGTAAGARARRAARFGVRAAPLRPAPAAARSSLRLRPDGALPVALPGGPRPQPVPSPP